MLGGPATASRDRRAYFGLAAGAPRATADAQSETRLFFVNVTAAPITHLVAGALIPEVGAGYEIAGVAAHGAPGMLCRHVSLKQRQQIVSPQ